jgi:hypothetical protein
MQHHCAHLISPDYVFDKTYNLLPLNEIESFVTKNKHLPDMPAAEQMKKSGVDLAQMNMSLLKKIEELTLHLIAQDKRIRELEKKVQVRQ